MAAKFLIGECYLRRRVLASVADACLSSKVTKTSLPRLSALNKVFQGNKERVTGIKSFRKRHIYSLLLLEEIFVKVGGLYVLYDTRF